MLRRVRNKLRKIRYYSAARPENGWTRAADIALVVSLVLAWPATWVSSAVSIETDTTLAITGRLGRLPDGSLMPYLDESKTGESPRAVGAPAGNFLFWVVDEYRGWPLTVSIRRHPPLLNLDILSEVAARKNVRLQKDDPLYAAFETMLAHDDRIQEMAALRQEAPIDDPQWWAWFAGAAAWWILLAFASSAVINMLRFISVRLAHAKKVTQHRRREQGRCVACGYDLTGLEFNERCPECGELTW